jgi:hypothetical protein
MHQSLTEIVISRSIQALDKKLAELSSFGRMMFESGTLTWETKERRGAELRGNFEINIRDWDLDLDPVKVSSVDPRLDANIAPTNEKGTVNGSLDKLASTAHHNQRGSLTEQQEMHPIAKTN